MGDRIVTHPAHDFEPDGPAVVVPGSGDAWLPPDAPLAMPTQRLERWRSWGAAILSFLSAGAGRRRAA
jgi:hypothetical protein